MTVANPFAAFQASQVAPVAAAPVGASPFGAQPAPAAGPQSGFGVAPVAVAPAPLAGPAAAPAPAGGFGIGMPSLDGVTESSGRLPDIPVGTSRLVFEKNTVKQRKGHSILIHFKIFSTDAAHVPQGTEVTFFQKISNDPDKRGKGLGAILACVRGIMGFSDEAAFKAAVPNWKDILAAVLAGQPAPWQGKHVWCLGIQGEPRMKADGTPTGTYWHNYQWAAAT